jgi:ribosomal protein S21
MATVVKKKPGESEDSLISRFRRRIQSEKLLIRMKEKQFYKKPSVKKAEKMAPIRRAKKRRSKR